PPLLRAIYLIDSIGAMCAADPGVRLPGRSDRSSVPTVSAESGGECVCGRGLVIAQGAGLSVLVNDSHVPLRRCLMLKLLYLLVSAMVIALPAAGLAQFSDKGDHVEVKKGTALCSNISIEGVRDALDQRRVFWRVTSPMRVNGTQDVSALVHETV